MLYDIILAIGFLLAVVMTRYRRCPSNKVLVVYGRGIGMPAGQLSKTLHGGGTIVLPILQDYRYLSLEPMQVQMLCVYSQSSNSNSPGDMVTCCPIK